MKMRHTVVVGSLLFAVVLAACEPTGSPSGTDRSSAALADLPECSADFGPIELIATSAEWTPTPRDDGAEVTAAGSLEINWNGSQGFGPTSGDDPYSMAIATLRNGYPFNNIVEQWQLNRANGPGPSTPLDQNGCDVSGSFPRCWLFAPADLVGGWLTAVLPTFSDGSNTDYDSSGQRIEVSGMTALDFGAGEPFDNSHGMFAISWNAPRGLDEALLLLRLRLDRNGDSDLAGEPFVRLLRIGYPVPGGDYISPALRVVEETHNRITVQGNVQDALDDICDNTDGECALVTKDLEFDGHKLLWTVENVGTEGATIDALLLEWPASNKKLKKIKRDDVTLYDHGILPSSALIEDGWKVGPEQRQIPAGATVVLLFEFEADAVPNGCAYLVRLMTAEGCTLRLEPGDVPPSANLCEDGKPPTLTLRYTGEGCDATSHSQDPSKVSCSGDPAGASPVRVLASNRSDPYDGGADVWFDGDVALGDAFVMDVASAGTDKFDSNSYVYVFAPDGTLLQSVRFHTSCSQPLEAGDQFGSVILDGTGAAMEPIDCDYFDDGDDCEGDAGDDVCLPDKPHALLFEYTGEGCDATSHAQDPSKVSCSGDPAGAPLVRALATNRSDPYDDGAKVWFDGDVALGETFLMDVANAGTDKFDANSYVHLFAPDGTLLQSIQFHTSCSQPLRVGDQFGSALLRNGFVDVPAGCFEAPGDGDDGGDDCTVAEGPDGDDVCQPDKPRALLAAYTGDGCDATSHDQDPSKVSCSGDPAGAPLVHVLVTNRSDPYDGGAKVWFDGEVAMGDTFVMNTTAAGTDKFDANSYAYVFAPDGTLLQSVQFHTSCSQPLRVGDQFGSVSILGGAATALPASCGGDGEDLASVDACLPDKPRGLLFEYTGEGCDATFHEQDPSKVSCSGDAGYWPMVRVRASNKANPNDAGARVWFEGYLMLGDTFVMDTANGGEDKFPADSYAHVFAPDGSLLQSVRFHTSCSQPLLLGYQFGSLLLRDASH